MKTNLKRSLLSAATLLIGVCSLNSSALLAQDSAAAPTAEPAAAPAPVQAEKAPGPVVNAPVKMMPAKPALWVVKDKDTTIYLFGTIHILKPGISWFDEAIKDAFDKSDELVIEMVEPAEDITQKVFLETALDKSGKTLSSKLNEKDRATYHAALKKLGMPEGSLDPFEPWAAGMTVQLLSITGQGFNPKDGAEAILTAAAKAKKMNVSGLETLEQQLGFFDTLPEETQIRFLVDGSADLEEGKELLDKLVEDWKNGKVNELAKSMNEGLEDPILFDQLLTKRNANWAQWIQKRMEKPGTTFMAVGAGHLSGKTSVPALLKKYKLKAKRVKY
jgi:uncharacterized protein